MPLLDSADLREQAEEAKEGGYRYVSMVSPDTILTLLDVQVEAVNLLAALAAYERVWMTSSTGYGSVQAVKTRLQAALGTEQRESGHTEVGPGRPGEKDGGPISRPSHSMTDVPAPSSPSRYELLRDDPRFGLSKGDILICEPMHPAWADEKVAVVRRESDGFDPGCTQYRSNVRHVSGPRS